MAAVTIAAARTHLGRTGEYLAWLGSYLATNWIFTIALAAGLVLRVFTMLGFPPAIWFGGDSTDYVTSGMTLYPGQSRVSGYGVMTDFLRPFHSFVVVTGVQHLMGLASAVLIYALLRHRYRLPAWGATLATLPVLLDAYVIQLEQEILPDSTFTFLIVIALTLVLWWPDSERPRWSLPWAAVCLGVATSFWPVGLPLLILLLVYVLVRKFGWRRLGATALAGAVPLVLYLGWYGARYRELGFEQSDGVFLWSRTMTFANCAVIKPPAGLRPLCPTTPADRRPAAPEYIWEYNSPLLKIGTGTDKFSSQRNSAARKFAIDAIEAQPLAYANTVLHSWLLTFTWNRPDVPNRAMATRYQFSNATTTQNDLGATTPAAEAADVAALNAMQKRYTDGHTADTREVQPFANIMIDYQKVMYLRGTMIGILMLIGLGGIVLAWRRGGFRRRSNWGGPALFPWLASLCMEVVPPATADFSLRYVVPTIPAACLAAALAFARPLQPSGAEAAEDPAPVEATQPEPGPGAPEARSRQPGRRL
jgi:Dolichyl-phosphate-mannose-protein mannosyltransferase